MFIKVLRYTTAAALLAVVGIPLIALAWVRDLGPPPPVADRGTVVSLDLHVDGQPLRVHALPTGFVTIKGCHHAGCVSEEADYLTRWAAILADPRFAEPLPIWTYAIEHPDGWFIVDTGPALDYYDPDSWGFDRVSERLLHSFIRLDVLPDEVLPARLKALGIAPEQVSAVVVTHQHVDHTGTVPAFEGVDIWTTRAEQEAADGIGALHPRWQNERTRLRFVDEEAPDGQPVALTSDGRIRFAHTPGHTPGSTTVTLSTDEGTVWFVGDTTFDLPGISENAVLAGIHTDPAAVRALHHQLRTEASADLILPAHDSEVGARMRQWRTR